MIGYLKGTLKNISTGTLIIDVLGVGYEVEAMAPAGKDLNDECELWIYTHVRENEIKLFGFDSNDKKSMFEMLLSVSGVGPKSAHLIVSFMDLSDIQSAILLGDPKPFTKLNGVGKKVSERIILELKDKVGKSSIAKNEKVVEDDLGKNNERNLQEVFDALIMLGYSMENVREALKGEDMFLPSNQLIKICLKKIKK